MAPTKTPDKPAAPDKPKLSPEQERIQAEKSKETFAKEMQFQCYRFENLFKSTDRVMVVEAAKNDPSMIIEPFTMKFLYSYTPENANRFISEAKEKSEAEREKLLEGIRRILYRAKAVKKEAEKNTKVITEQETKAKEESDKEAEKFNTMMKKELSEAELSDIENNMTKPFDIRKGQIDMDKVQHQYKSIIMGQKALGTHMQRFQGKFNEALKNIKEHEKNYKGFVNGSVVGYGYRKIKSGLGWLGNKLGISDKPSKPIENKTNEQILSARKFYGENLSRIKNLQKNIDARSAQIKEGLGIYKGDVREKLRALIGRQDWAKAMQAEKEEAKKKMEEKKRELQESLKRAQTQGNEIDDAKKTTTGLGAKLKSQTDKIQSGETTLDNRVSVVQSRIKKLEELYGAKDPRVIEMRQNVLVPLLEGKDRMGKVKNGTAEKLNDIEERNQKLDILKANIYLNETQSVAEIEKLELLIKTEDKKIDLLGKQRVELGNVIEGVEVAYAAIDDFKKNITANLDKMTKDNGQAVGAIEKQYEYLKSAKVKEPGLGTALWNTPLLGKYGALGVLDYGMNKSGAIILSYLTRGKWDEKFIESWSLTGMLGRLSGGLNKWLDKGGFKGDEWYGKLFAGVGNFGAGVLSTGLSLVQGVYMLVLQPHKVIDALGEMVTDWKKFKETFLHVVHYNDWAEGRFGAALGRTAGDLIVLFFTAGSSAGAQAAAKAGHLGGRMAAKSAAYALAFTKEIGRQSLNGAAKVGRFALNTVAHPILSIKALTVTPLRNAYNWTRATVKGDRQLYNLQRAEGKYITAQTTLREGIAGARAETILKGTKSTELKSLLERLKAEIKGEETAAAAAKVEAKAGEAVKGAQIEFNFNKPALEPASRTLSKMSVEELKTLSMELSQELYRATAWSTRNAIDALGKQVNSYMRARVEVIARTEVLFNSRFVEGSVVKVLKEGQEEAGWIVGRDMGKGNVQIYRMEKGVKAAEEVVSKEAVLSWNRGAMQGSVSDIKAVFEGRFKTGDEVIVRTAADKLDNGWKIGKTSDDGLVQLSKGTETVTVTREGLLRSNSAMPARFWDIRRRRGQIKEELGNYLGKEDIFSRTRMAELKAEYQSLNRGVMKPYIDAARADAANLVASNPALASQRGLVEVSLLSKLSSATFKALFIPPFIPLAGLATFFRFSKKNASEVVARFTGEAAVNLNALGKISGKINELVKAGNLKNAVQLYNAARVAAKGAGVPFPFTAMDTSFLGYLHRVMPYSAVVIAGVTRLADPLIVENLPEKTDVNIGEVSKMEKEHSEAMRKMIEAETKVKP